MRQSTLNERRRALVDKLVEAVTEHADPVGGLKEWSPIIYATLNIDQKTQEKNAVDALRARFTALLASRWQT